MLYIYKVYQEIRDMSSNQIIKIKMSLEKKSSQKTSQTMIYILLEIKFKLNQFITVFLIYIILRMTLIVYITEDHSFKDLKCSPRAMCSKIVDLQHRVLFLRFSI